MERYTSIWWVSNFRDTIERTYIRPNMLSWLKLSLVWGLLRFALTSTNTTSKTKTQGFRAKVVSLSAVAINNKSLYSMTAEQFSGP